MIVVIAFLYGALRNVMHQVIVIILNYFPVDYVMANPPYGKINIIILEGEDYYR
ncbi:hypothetical protein [Crocosphaera sp.]|uniref:hypothetical protein n=1 Tax=Crocosphaera sp. TaxID=2729996 RepID=UPI003F1FA485|nr:hypothetical protein [Crocosphaera sp.]